MDTCHNYLLLSDLYKIYCTNELTLRDQCIVGTGLPEALHSKVTVPPFLAVNCPVEGDVLILGGTKTDNKSRYIKK